MVYSVGADRTNRDCPLKSVTEKLGLLEGLQCDFCTCVNDPRGAPCTTLADNICLTETPHPSCTTVLFGFMSDNGEDVGRAAAAIRDRCPRLQHESADMCACLRNSESQECNGGWMQKCSTEPSLCVDKILGLQGDTDAHIRYIESVVEACGEEQKLVVFSKVVTRSTDSMDRHMQDQLRAELADLVEQDVGSVTFLGYESMRPAGEPQKVGDQERLNVSIVSKQKLCDSVGDDHDLCI